MAQIQDIEFQAKNGVCNVFLTGVTGFVGRYLLYQLCEANWVNEIYVLIRPKRGTSADERFEELMKEELFQAARKMGVRFDNIHLIIGDILEPRLGMSEESIHLLSTRVSLVIHNAAAISFGMPMQDSLKFNTRPSWNLYKMCSREFELRPAFVLLSSIATNSHMDTVPEEITPFSGSAESIYNFIESIPKERCNEQEEWLREGRLDNYGFSKGLTERMIFEDIEANGSDIPVHIVRPGGIIAAQGGPIPGWMHETCFYGQLAYFIYKGKIPFFRADRTCSINMGPVDLVCNLTMACCLECLEKRSSRTFDIQVVNASITEVEGVTFDSLLNTTRKNIDECQQIARKSYADRYHVTLEEVEASGLFQDGAPRDPWYFRSKWMLDLLFSVCVFFPMFLLKLWEGESKRYKSASKLTNFLYKYVHVLAPYLLKQLIVDRGHAESLHKKYEKTYPCDASCIEMEEFNHLFIKGVSQFIAPSMCAREHRMMKKLKGVEPHASEPMQSKAA